MQRVAFLLRLRPGAEAAYDKAHEEVWPEMLALLKRAGISEYSIFRREQLLVLSMQVDNFDETWARIEADPVNRWQTIPLLLTMRFLEAAHGVGAYRSGHGSLLCAP